MDADDDIPPNATVYVKNLEERIKIPVLIESLRGIFSEYGNIVDIVAKKSLKRKGQAFIVYDSVDSAQNAIDEVNGFELHGKQINCEFAKTQSDATVERNGSAGDLEKHKRARLAEKERKQAAEAAELAKKRPADEPAAGAAPAKVARPAGQVPDEYLPPNNVLMVHNAPASYSVDDMTAIFSRFAAFKEYNEVPFREGLAFVHYDNEAGAIEAKNSVHGIDLGGTKLVVTYRRK